MYPRRRCEIDGDYSDCTAASFVDHPLKHCPQQDGRFKVGPTCISLGINRDVHLALAHSMSATPDTVALWRPRFTSIHGWFGEVGSLPSRCCGCLQSLVPFDLRFPSCAILVLIKQSEHLPSVAGCDAEDMCWLAAL